MSSNERHRRLQIRKARLDEQQAAMSDVLRGLTGPQSEAVEYINVKGPHAFSSEATLLLRAGNRERAVTLLGMFPPEGLDVVWLSDGGKSFVTSSTIFAQGRLVRSRDSIAPFLYSVVQTRKVARHTLLWVHKLENGSQVAVECDIAQDRAAFRFEHLDDQARNQVLFRRIPNDWVPQGAAVEVRGTNWSPVKDVTASITIWWPYTHPNIISRKLEEENWPPSIEELAFVLLEVRQEAQAWLSEGQ